MLNELENSCSSYKCHLADMEGEFEKWKKALELLVACFCNNKMIDRLHNFYKVCNDDRLKETLKPVLKK